MKRQSHYKTKQQALILDYLSSLKGKHVTVNQISEHFKLQNTPIGTATIYRHLEKLVDEGQVKKYLVDGIIGACFQYVDSNETEYIEYHFKCDKCGKLFHQQCRVIDELENHISDTHNFQINASKTIFYGTCTQCASR